MKVKAIDILEKFEALGTLADKETDLTTAINIAKNLKELSISKDVIDKKRNDIIMKYAVKDSDNKVKQNEDGSVGISDIKSFNEDVNGMLNEEIEVELITLKEDKIKDLKISAKNILPLLDILD